MNGGISERIICIMKKISILCILLLTLSICIPASAIEYKDIVQDETLVNKLDILDGLGIFDGMELGAFNESGNITRGEFAQMMANLCGYGMVSADYTSRSEFSDVRVGTPLCGSLNYLSIRKVVVGSGGGLFKADDNITLEQAASMFGRMLGYEAAYNQIGKTDPVTNIASSGIIPGGALGKGGTIDWKTAVTMIYNSLDAKMITESYSAANPSYSVDKDATPLSYYLKCSKSRGVITANSVTSLDVSDGAGSHSVVIDGYSYDAGDTDIEAYIGHKVEFYYCDPLSDGDYTIKAFTSKSKTVTIQSEDMERYENHQLEYSKDGSGKYYVKLSNIADFLFNGVAYPDIAEEEIIIDNGYITFIDNDDDNRYDVAYITSYESYVVNNVSGADGQIYVRGKTDAIDLQDDNLERLEIYDEDMAGAVISDIQIDDVITVAKDKLSKTMTIYLSRKTVKGSITSKSEDELEINYIPYKYNKSFEKRLAPLSGSTEREFLLDFRGRVTDLKDKVNRAMQYGCYVRAYYLDETMDGDIEMKIFTDEGVFERYILAEKLIVDGSRLKPDDLLKDSRFIIENENSRYNIRLIKYKLNGEGQISTIVTDSSTGNSSLEESLTPLDLSGVSYKAGPKYFTKKAYMTSETLLFKIPALTSTSFEDEAYSLNKFQLNDNMKYNNIYAYDVDDGGEAAAIVYKVPYVVTNAVGGSDIPGDEAACVIVKSIKFGQNRDEEIVPIITYVEKGVERTCAARTDETVMKQVYNEEGVVIPDKFKYVSKGDIVKLSIDDTGEISGMTVCLDSDRTDSKIYTTNSGEICGFDYGIVYSKGNSGIRMASTVDANGNFIVTSDALTALPINNVSITVYDRDENEIRNGTIYDVKDYISCGGNASKAFVRSKYYEPREIFIIQE